MSCLDFVQLFVLSRDHDPEDVKAHETRGQEGCDLTIGEPSGLFTGDEGVDGKQTDAIGCSER